MEPPRLRVGSDRLAPKRCARRPAARQRPLADGENFFGKVSFLNLPSHRSITSSAGATKLSGTWRPNILAILITSWKSISLPARVPPSIAHGFPEDTAMTARRQWLRLGFLCLIAAAAPAGSLAHAQSYPSGPVKFITQIAAGSGTDPAMRVVIEQLGRMWGQQTVLVNQPGAGGVLAARAAYTATADGHTLFMAVASTFTVLPQLQPNLSINVDEFVPIGFVGEVPMAIAVTPSLPVSSLPELIARS